MSNKVYFRFIPRSLDGLFNPEIKNAHVPKWNYVLLRFQVFFFGIFYRYKYLLANKLKLCVVS